MRENWDPRRGQKTLQGRRLQPVQVAQKLRYPEQNILSLPRGDPFYGLQTLGPFTILSELPIYSPCHNPKPPPFPKPKKLTQTHSLTLTDVHKHRAIAELLKYRIYEFVTHPYFVQIRLRRTQITTPSNFSNPLLCAPKELILKTHQFQ